ncbi:type II toxin-antitoxin system HipA family toxin [Bosea sp. RAC05]|uniref:type II toxin-antitoxin system HipA family toxin n=1 Tax=Bosea sp. RAC05 TaxID=1842539 RepID=UPI00083D3427|nr:type II toxin-antitoxin system HipA family toxin [Bosea sp. RAC05]AOG03321.1 hypothetical protein BSY19_4704 [Bosea sp. RAC05]
MVDIFYERTKVGRVDTGSGQAQLIYDPAWISRSGSFPISLRMPLRPEPYEHGLVITWLANLLPESHLQEIGQAIGVSPQDVLGLLKSLGRDTAGALAIDKPREQGDEFRVVETEAELERIITELPRKPFLVGEEGVSMSLAGVQEKLAVAVVDGRIAIPVKGTASTHILKPDSLNLKGSVANEAFCLSLAKAVGIETSKVTTGVAGKRSYLLVERYDRLATKSGIRRIHQEDLCQTLGFLPKDKYEYTGFGRTGPGIVALFNAVESRVSPGERLKLLDYLILNVLVGNTDAHAKNYSLLIGAGGSAKLAPLYDVLCAEIYKHVTRNLPQRIAGRTTGADLTGTDWIRLARDVGLNPQRTLDRVDELASLVSLRADEVRDEVAAMPTGGSNLLDQVCFETKKRTKRIQRQLETRDFSTAPSARDWSRKRKVDA